MRSTKLSRPVGGDFCDQSACARTCEGLTVVSCLSEGVADDPRIPIDERQKHASGPARLPAPLLPLPNGSDRHAKRTGELGLGVGETRVVTHLGSDG